MVKVVIKVVMRMVVMWNIDLNQFGVFDKRQTDRQTGIGDCRVTFATKTSWKLKLKVAKQRMKVER